MLTAESIKYTEDFIFKRLGLQHDYEKFSFNGMNVDFRYCSDSDIRYKENRINILKNEFANESCFLEKTDLIIDWLKADQIFPGYKIDTPLKRIPIIFWGDASDRKSFASIVGKSLQINIDLIASIFYMISRYEEYNSRLIDDYSRFSYHEMLAVKNDFIDLPVVDIYIELFRRIIEIFFEIEVKNNNTYEVIISSDIDEVFLYHPFSKGIKTIIKDALYYRFSNLFSDSRKIFQSYLYDDFYSGIEILCNLSKLYSIKTNFNFMASNRSKMDDGYSIKSIQMGKIFERLEQDNFEIGFHPSYYTLNNPELYKMEKNLLQSSVNQRIISGRQHFLRVNTPASWIMWEENGMKLDSSYGFSEILGFRCGTSFPYQVFDIRTNKKLDLIEQPLIIMDGALRRNSDLSNAREVLLSYKKITQFVKGQLTILWHNRSFSRHWKDWGLFFIDVLRDII